MILGRVGSPMEWEHWPEARTLILRSVERDGDVTIEEVEADLHSDQAQLWCVLEDGVKLAGVTQLILLPSGKQCFIWQLGGEWRGYSGQLFAEVEKWARAEGCVSIEGNMRPGFERLLGWRKMAVIMRKDLVSGQK